MSQTIFDARINRITNRTRFKRSDLAIGEGCATPMFSSPLQDVTSARGYFGMVMLGLLAGAVVGILAAGLHDPAMPWGPNYEFNALMIQPVSLALLAAPFLAMLACMMQSRYHRIYYFSIAYFPAALGAAFAGTLPIVASLYPLLSNVTN